MVITVQQPEHFPWVGFFNKMLSVDEFIYLDNVQFKKRYFENRNKIRTNTADNWQWVTVPVITKDLYTQKIKEVRIDYTQKWQRRYINKLSHYYSRAPFFDEIFQGVREIIDKRFERIIELNLELINFIKAYLDITTSAMLASDICDGKGSDLILDLCIKRNASVYLSGPDGRNYLEPDGFCKNNITIGYHDYTHPGYRQIYEPFIPNMSAIDLLFNHGRDSLAIIKGNSKT